MRKVEIMYLKKTLLVFDNSNKNTTREVWAFITNERAWHIGGTK